MKKKGTADLSRGNSLGIRNRAFAADRLQTILCTCQPNLQQNSQKAETGPCSYINPSNNLTLCERNQPLYLDAGISVSYVAH